MSNVNVQELRKIITGRENDLKKIVSPIYYDVLSKCYEEYGAVGLKSRPCGGADVFPLGCLDEAGSLSLLMFDAYDLHDEIIHDAMLKVEIGGMLAVVEGFSVRLKVRGLDGVFVDIPENANYIKIRTKENAAG